MAAAWCLRKALNSPLVFRGLATVIPKVSQVDNSSDFLGKVPHRQHPGVLHLKNVRLPPELVEVARFLVAESSMHNLEQQTKALTNYLWSRKRPLEAADLRRKAQQLEQQFREKKNAMGLLDEEAEAELQKKVLAALRRATYHWEELKYTEDLSFIYMAARMDGVFAAVTRAFHEIQKRVLDFQPRTLLDFGSGTGAVTWAAHSIWGKTINEYMNIDVSASMLALAERLMKGISEDKDPCIPGVYFRQFLPVSPKVKFDLVVSAFSLNELHSYAQRAETVQTLWRKTGGFLVLVENGTKEGHQMLMEARDLVLHGTDKVVHDPTEPSIFAPCPHHLPCPRLSPDRILPCNFIQTYFPLPFSWTEKEHIEPFTVTIHVGSSPARGTKPRGAQNDDIAHLRACTELKNPPKKEEKFSYLILRRGSGEPERPWPRITKPVLCRDRHVHVHLCCADGSLQHAVITSRKHTRDLYRCARNCKSGDRLPVSNLDSEPDLGEERGDMDEDQS